MKNIVVFVFLLIFSSEVFSMGFGPKVCLASELTMTVLKNGNPIEGAKVVRTYQKSFGDEVIHSQEAVTDGQGKITLPAVFDRTFRKFLPMESWVNQNVVVSHNDMPYSAIKITKSNLDNWGELNDMALIDVNDERFMPNEFICDLSNEVAPRLVKRHTGATYAGVCKHISE